MSCDASKAALKKFNPSGSWDYLVKNTPMGDVPGTLMLDYAKETGWSGKLSSDQGEAVLNNLVVDGKKLSAEFDFQGAMMDFVVDFLSDSEMKGQIKSGEFGAFDLTGKRN